MKTVQDFMISDLLEVEDSGSNETVELLTFLRENSVPMTKHQLQAIFMLKENGLEDIANFAYNAKRVVTPSRMFFDMVSKLTLADRIKGNAKLSHLLKANANPAGSMKPEDVQAKSMSKKEIDK